MLQCPTCSARLERASRFCPACGSALSGPDFDDATLLSEHILNPSIAPGRSAISPPPSAAWLAPHSSGEHVGFAPGTLVGGRFRIIGLLGRGGMGDVYRADDLVLGQPVALKFLPRDLAQDTNRLTRFFGEVRIARTVSHPNVCRVYDIGEIDGQPYMSMELVDGDDLASLLRRIGRLPADKALEVSRQLCAGVAAAHEKGVLHRDLKPANVIIDAQGKVRITDFGLAVLADEHNKDQARAGTPAYMAPEQLSRNEVSVQSDLYSLGVVLYEMFTGHRAFHGNSLLEVQRLHEESAPPNPTTLLTDLDPVIERAILRCLEKDPHDRPPSALAVAAALPGGDPLAAALAAGELPSPEIVAAAGGEGALRPAVAWGLAAFIVVGLAIGLSMAGQVLLIRQVPLDKPPAVLAERAAEILRMVHHQAPQVDQARGFDVEDDYLRWVAKNDKSPHRWDGLRRGRPAAIRFWYRTSPRELRHTGFGSFGVSLTDPPQNVSGQASVTLDPLGRLLQLEVEPAQRDTTPDPGTTPDWGPLFAAAELDPARFTSTAPQWTPPAYCDTRVAWKGSDAARPDTLRVEAGSYHGRPTSFALIGPWSRPTRMLARPLSRGERFSQALVAVLLLTVLVAGVQQARRTIQRKQADTRGAWRLAIYVMVTISMAWLLAENHTSSLSDEYRLFTQFLGLALYICSLIWVLYVALEPLVRRRWPDSLIGWNRLLAGRWRDPWVGRDVLIGLALGVCTILLATLQTSIPRWLGLPPPKPLEQALASLEGFRYSMANLLGQQSNSIFLPMALVFLLVALRSLLRRQWLAVLVILVLFVPVGAAEGDNPWIDYPLSALGFGLLLFVTVRFGLLAAIFGMFVSNLLSNHVATIDSSQWYAPASLFACTILLALLLYSFRTAIGNRPLFKARLMPET